MSDPLRTDQSHQGEGDPGVARDAKIEDLLLNGLDHYFGERYEHAINIWTRVLFLDRGHARARAYIERARSALAEQLRESEELLHGGVAAFDRGEIDRARGLLNSALERGGPNEIALALLARLNRLESAGYFRTATSPDTGTAVPESRQLFEQPTRKGFNRIWIAVATPVLIAVLGTLWVARPTIVATLGLALQKAAGPRATVKPPEEPLPVPLGSEVVLSRARALELGGHLSDALRLLDDVRPTDPLRPEVDRLKTEIQGRLLATVRIDPRPPQPTRVVPTTPVPSPQNE
jgi:tetratricopeptide (TPR) repeat protein